MKMTFAEAFETLMRGETFEDYEKRKKRIHRLANERDALMDALAVLSEADGDRYYKKQKRLSKVLEEIERLNY